MSTPRCAARLAATTLAEALLLAALVEVGHRRELRVPFDELGPWLHHADAATVVVASVRWAAMAAAAWLLASTLLYAAAAMSRAPALLAAVRWSTLPAVRRVVDAACAVSVASAVVLTPSPATAARAADSPSVTVVRDGRGDGPIAALPPDPVPSAAPSPPATVPATTPAAAPAVTAGEETVEVVVVAGDNLWSIAASRVALVRGVGVSEIADADVAPYWRLVCGVNRDRLRSGDLDLIHPGERVVLPPVA